MLPGQTATTSSQRVAAGDGYSVLYSFRGGRDGRGPVTALLSANGELYGTTLEGGGHCTSSASGCGTVFAMNAKGQKRVLYRFAGTPTDGAGPFASLIAYNGSFYGTTRYGGLGSGGYYGTVYMVSSSGKERVLYSFRPAPDGSNPSSLVEADNEFFGTTAYGGQFECGESGSTIGCGTVFSLSLSGREKILHDFRLTNPGKDGVMPHSGFTLRDGRLYGTTTFGGTGDGGTVFRMDAAGDEHLLHAFGPVDLGYYPWSALTYYDGEFYGTTSEGGSHGFGTVFTVAPTGKERVVYSFKKPPADGLNPVGKLTVVNGNFYGVTTNGGPYKCLSTGLSCGTIFKVSPSGKESVLHNFEGGKDGEFPEDGLTLLDGRLYGTTYAGGSGACGPSSGSSGGCGTVFAISP